MILHYVILEGITADQNVWQFGSQPWGANPQLMILNSTSTVTMYYTLYYVTHYDKLIH